ncbi:MAG: Tol-Pal system beta propeller repeat protein TolB [Acidobacteria bacterium]|nr:Tol-Pal system beta propeller repeat protein TolB [Acidobacteriota bacterium]
MKNRLSVKVWLVVTLFCLKFSAGNSLQAQEDIIRTGTGLGVERTRLAVSSFRASADSISLRQVFDDVLWNDLDYAGIFDLASRSFYPLSLPSRPDEVKAEEWTRPPVSAYMVVLGNTYRAGDQLVIEGWLVDPRNATQPVVLGKRYVEEANDLAARRAAHKFANEIIYRLGGGIPGIAETRIAFVRRMSPQVKEIWMMDYDGANQERMTHLNTLSLTPAISVDGTQIAFTSYQEDNPAIVIFSLLTRKPLSFINRRGLNTTPTWSPDGTKLAFTSSVTGDPEIYVADARGRDYKRLTVARGVDISPSWNPKTGAQIAFVSDRSGQPMIYMMDSDGANVTQLVSGGSQALDPAWSPNGRLLAFTWSKEGEYNIYVLDVATRDMVQLTRDSGRNEHPSWSPDNRHIVFQSNRRGSTQIWTMLADGSKPRQLTFERENTEPVWSSR